MRADARQKQTMESYSPETSRAPTAHNQRGTQTDEDSAAFVMSWMEVCECLTAPTSTDSDVCPFSPSVSPSHTLQQKNTLSRCKAEIQDTHIYIYIYKLGKAIIKRESFISNIIAPRPRGIRHSCVIVGVSNRSVKDSHAVTYIHAQWVISAS